MTRAYLLSQEDVAALREWQQWKRSLNGPGVTNTPNTVSIGKTPTRRRGVPLRTIGGGGSPVVRMVIKELFNDYLRCRRVVEPEQGTLIEDDTDVLVAKPQKLRHLTPNFDDVVSITSTTTNRITATDDDGNEEIWQTHWPYRVDDQIRIDRPAGGTGVWVSGNQLVFEDTNRDARFWKWVE